jgi:hypothetical protein
MAISDLDLDHFAMLNARVVLLISDLGIDPDWASQALTIMGPSVPNTTLIVYRDSLQ